MANGQTTERERRRQDPDDEQEQENPFLGAFGGGEPDEQVDGEQEQEPPDNPFAGAFADVDEPEPAAAPEEEPEPGLFERARELAGRLRGGLERIQGETEEIEETARAGMTGAELRPPPAAPLEEDPATRGQDLELGPEGVQPTDPIEATGAPRTDEEGVRAPTPPPDPTTQADGARAQPGAGIMPRPEGRERPLPEGVRVEDPLTGELRPETAEVLDQPTADPELGVLRGLANVFGRGVGTTIESTGAMLRATDLERAGGPLELPSVRGEPLTMGPDRPLLPGQGVVGEGLDVLGQRVMEEGEEIREFYPASGSVQEGGAFQPRNWRWWMERGGDAMFTLGLSMGSGGLAAARGFGKVGRIAAWATPTAVLEGGGAYQEAYQFAREEGMDDDEADAVASGAAMATAAGASLLELGPARFFMFDRLPGLRGDFAREFMQKMARHPSVRVGAGMTTEGFQELSQEAWGSTIQRTLVGDPEAFADFVDRALAATVLGAGAGGVAAGGRVLMDSEKRRQFDREFGPQLEQLPTEAQDAIRESLGLEPSRGRAADAVEPADEAAADVEGSEPGQEIEVETTEVERRSVRRRLADFMDPTARREREQLQELTAEQQEQLGARQAELEDLYRDQKFDVASTAAWERARDRISDDPEQEVVMLDVRNLHGMNSILGSHAEADRFMKQRMVDEVKRVAANMGIEDRNIFRAGGDEFTVAVPRGTGEAFAAAVEERVGEPQIGDSPFRSGFRTAVAERAEDADALIVAAKETETSPRFRDDEGLTAEAQAALEQVGGAEAEEVAPPPEVSAADAEITPVPEVEAAPEPEPSAARARVEEEAGPTPEPLPEPLESLARRGVNVEMPGISDVTDRQVLRAELSRLPEEQRDAVLERIAEIKRTEPMDPVTGQRRVPQEQLDAEAEAEVQAAVRRQRVQAIQDEVPGEVLDRAGELAERDDAIGREAARTFRMAVRGELDPAEFVEEIADFEQRLLEQREVAVDVESFARAWEEETGTELPRIFEQWIPRRQFVEERGVRALPRPDVLRADIVNQAATMERERAALAEGTDPATTEELTDAQREAMRERIRRVQAELTRKMELFRDAFGFAQAQAVFDDYLHLESDPVTRFVDRVRQYSKPAVVSDVMQTMREWSDAKLTERYEQYVRRWTRLVVKGNATEARDQRASMNNWGEIVTGTKSTTSGMNARGNRTQQASRIVAAAALLRSRGASVRTEREIMNDLRRSDIHPQNHDLWDQLPEMSVEQIRRELEEESRAVGTLEGATNQVAQEAIILAYRELERRGVDNLDEITTDGHTSEGPFGVREQRPSWVVREGAADMEGWWYSKIIRAVDEAPFVYPQKGEVWWARIRKYHEGVSKDEIEWTGVKDALLSRENRHRAMTRAEVEQIVSTAPRLTERKLATFMGDVEGLEWKRAEGLPDRFIPFVDGQQIHEVKVDHNRSADQWVVYHSASLEVFEGPDAREEAFRDARERIQERVSLSEGVRPRYARMTYRRYGLRPESRYREILVQFTPKAGQIQVIPQALDGRLEVLERKLDTDEITDAERMEWAGLRGILEFERETHRGHAFRHTHWGNTPNVLFHIRATERPWGSERFLHTEEIQSDLHQVGRKAGYSGEPGTADRIAVLTDQMREDLQRLYDLGYVMDINAGRPIRLSDGQRLAGRRVVFDDRVPERPYTVSSMSGAFPGTRRFATEEEALQEIRVTTGFKNEDVLTGEPVEVAARIVQAVPQIRTAATRAQQGTRAVPPAPMRETSAWVGAAVRRMFQEAALENTDGVSFTTGDQISEALNLRQFVERIEWDPETAELQGWDTDGAQVVNRFVSREDLPSVVGDEIAAELQSRSEMWMVASEGEVLETGRSADAAWERYSDGLREQGQTEEEIAEERDIVEIRPMPAVVEGDELEVGGAGNREFYDRIVRDVVTKEARRLGLTVEQVPITEPTDDRQTLDNWIIDEVELRDLSDAHLENALGRIEREEAMIVPENIAAVRGAIHAIRSATGATARIEQNNRQSMLFRQMAQLDEEQASALEEFFGVVQTAWVVRDRQEHHIWGLSQTRDAAISQARKASEEFDDAMALEAAREEGGLQNNVVRLTPEARHRILNEGLPTIRERGQHVHGSPRDELAAFDEIMDLAQRNRERIQIVRGVGSQAWVDIRGQTMRDAETARVILEPFRSKRQELFHWVLRGDDDTVLSHSYSTSGAIDFFEVTKREIHETIARARRMGATKVTLAHNHPAGDPTPSLDDLLAMDNVSRFFRDAGLEVQVVVINGDSVAEFDPGSWTTEDAEFLRRLSRRGMTNARHFDGFFELKQVEGLRGEPRQFPPVKMTPENVAETVKRLQDRRNDHVWVMYLDNRHGVVALENRHVSEVDRAGRWMPQQLRAYGAATTVIASDARSSGSPGRIVDSIMRQRLNSMEVMDVVFTQEGSEDVRSARRDLLPFVYERREEATGRPRRLRDAGEGYPSDRPGPADLFGERTEGEVEQSDLLGPAPVDTITSARATVSRLEGKIERGDASASEVERYEQARSLIRTAEQRGLDDEEVRRQRRQSGTEDVTPDDNLDLFDVRDRSSDYDPAAPKESERLRAEIAALEDQVDQLSDSDEDIARYDELDDRIAELRDQLEVADAVESGHPERAAELALGTTTEASHGLFMLPDGRFLDGSEGTDQRRLQHEDIARFFSNDLADAGSGQAFSVMMMRRGSVRFTRSPNGTLFVEHIRPLTEEQRAAITEAFQPGDEAFLLRATRDGAPYAEQVVRAKEEIPLAFENLTNARPDGGRLDMAALEEEPGDGFTDVMMEVDQHGDGPTKSRTALPSDLLVFDQIIEPRLPGRLERPARPLPGAPVSANQVIDAIADVTEAAGRRIPLRVGRLSSKRATGEFKVRPEVMRTLTANRISTASHEMAHALEKVLWGWPKGGPWSKKITGVDQQIQDQLVTLGKLLYGDTTPSGGYKREGWAEFIRAWITQDSETLARAPAVTEWFEYTFLPDHTDVAAALERARWMSARYQGQGATVRAEANMEDPASWTNRFKQGVQMVRQAFTLQKWVEMAEPLAQLTAEVEQRTGQDVAPEDDPFFLVSALRTTHSARVKRMVENGMLDLAGNQVGPALEDVRGLVNPKEYTDFAIYLWARRAEALWTDPQGPRDPGISYNDTAQILEELAGPRFERAAEIVYDWNEGVLNYAAQASPVFAHVVKLTRARDPGSYVPLQRVFDDLDAGWQAPRGAAATADSPVARLKGSSRRIKDPIQAMIAKAEQTVRAAHTRAVIDSIVELSKTEGLGYLIEEVPKDQIPVAHRNAVETFEQLRRELRQQGAPADIALVDPAEGEPIDVQSVEEEMQDVMLTFFGPKLEPDNKEPIVPIFTGQDRGIVWFRVDAQIFDALGALDIYRLPMIKGLPILEKTLGLHTNIFRAFTTGLRTSFGLIWNPTRDFQEFYHNTRSSAPAPVLFKEWMSAIASSAFYRTTGQTGNPYLEAFLNLGGEMSLPLGQDIPHTRRAAKRIVGGKVTRTLDPRNWFDWYRDFVQFPEYAPRVAELKLLAKEVGWEPGAPMSMSQALEMQLAFKQVTTDFTAFGEWSRAMNRMVPFHNVSIQGPRAAIRAGRRSPAKVAWKGLMLTMMTMFLWWRHKDEEWYQELDPLERSMHWWFKVRNGDREELVRLPRSHELGMVYSALPEALLDRWYREDPDAVTQWMETFVRVSSPPVLPQSASVAAEQLANWQFYWDRPIVPMGEERLPPEEQFNEYTSIVARFVGDVTGSSPRRIDHLIGQGLGPFARDVIEITGLGGRGTDRGGREAEPADIPILGRVFYRGGTSGPDASVDNLFDELERAEEIQASMRREESEAERQRRLMMRDATRAISALSLVSRAVEGVDQRRALDELRRDIAQAAVQAPPEARAQFTELRRTWEERGQQIQEALAREETPEDDQPNEE